MLDSRSTTRNVAVPVAGSESSSSLCDSSQTSSGPFREDAPQPSDIYSNLGFRMRLAYFVSAYPAVSHTFIRREIFALRRRGAEIHTFGIRPPGPEEICSESDQRECAATWYIHPIGAFALIAAHALAFGRRPASYFRTLRETFRHRVPGIRSALWGLFYFAEAIVLSRELECRGIRHLHTHFANAGGTISLLAARFLGISWSLTIHGSKAEFDFPAAPLLGAKVAAARFVACVSHYGRSQVLRVTDPICWAKVTVARCGVELDALPPRLLGRGDERFRVLCVGRLVPEKAQRGLVEAFSELVERGEDGELVLIGNGPDRALIELEIEKRGLTDRCHMLGSRSESEVLREIAQADVLASSSLMEGLPVVLMEAMALGVPAVAPRLSGIPELVEDEVTGLLYTPACWTELAECLVQLSRDHELRERIGTAGRARIRAEFDIERAVEPLWEEFARIK